MNQALAMWLWWLMWWPVPEQCTGSFGALPCSKSPPSLFEIKPLRPL